jgi:hypothetical protein
MQTASWWMTLAGGCMGMATGDDVAPPIVPDATAPSCTAGDTYPSPAVEPMALGEILFPYSWPAAVHRGSAVSAVLDLANVPCNLDAATDWSPFDVLLFVSIPAW